MSEFSFYPKLLLRAPSRAFDMGFTADTLRSLLNDPAFIESIFIASPVLYAECQKWKHYPETVAKDRERKLLISLAKYYMRMTTRATPFGLFSGCTAIDWKDDFTNPEEIVRFHRHTRLDMHCLCLLSESISKNPQIRTKLQYRPNNSMYQIGHTLRYVEYVYIDGYRSYQISSIPFTPHIQSLLATATDGVSYERLITELCKQLGATPEDAADFLNEVIDAQVLVNNLEPAITACNHLDHIIKTITTIDTSENVNQNLNVLVEKMMEIKTLLSELDQPRANDISSYKSIIEKLGYFEVPLDSTKLFQVDLIGSCNLEGLPDDLQPKLIAAMEACEQCSDASVNTRLKKFQQALSKRYESQEKSLLEMLDEEFGIGYSKQETELDLADIVDSADTEEDSGQLFKWTKKTQMIFSKVMTAAANAQQFIEISPEDLASISEPTKKELPPSMAITFRCFKKQDESIQVCFENAHGSSAVNLLARFAYGDDSISQWCFDIAAQEDQINNEVCFAEIIHLPERRTGNILLHPPFRTIEIPYLARSFKKVQDQIAATDLMVSVHANRILLRDKKTGKQVIPRLSSAHNYSLRALPLYRFLGDMQHQQLRPYISFSWGSLQQLLHFFPRVYYQGVILSPAAWQFSKQELKILLNQPELGWRDRIQQFVTHFKLPAIFQLSEGDNLLPVFTSNEMSVMVFLETIKIKSTIRLQEIPGIDAGQDVDEAIAKACCRQYIASIINRSPVYKSSPSADTRIPSDRIQRNFMPATEWVYYKLYCTNAQADRILVQVVLPLISKIKQKRIADKWFFIRYNDPDFHIRLRFHSVDPHCVQEIIGLVSEALATAPEDLHIWNTQLDTYNREIERYGAATITNAETIFCIDSEAVLYFVQQRISTTEEDLSYYWLMMAIDQMLQAFSFPLADKQQLLNTMRDGFGREVNANGEMDRQIDTRYRAIRQKIEQVLAGATDIWTEELINQLSKRKNALQQEALRIKDTLIQQNTAHTINDLLRSYIHMTCNRVFPKNTRQQEFIIYDFLLRYYRSQLARQKNNIPAHQII